MLDALQSTRGNDAIMMPHQEPGGTAYTCWVPPPGSWLSCSVPGTPARGHSSSYPPLEVRATLLRASRFAFD
jgi:hypothetical protein